MSAQTLASLFDYLSVLAIAVWATLYGYKVVGNKTGTPNYDKLYTSWGKHLKWFGPLLIAITLLRMALWIWV